ncbi:hypothetical protein SHIRM173S_01285 [Streptomyces hirsutus]
MSSSATSSGRSFVLRAVRTSRPASSSTESVPLCARVRRTVPSPILVSMSLPGCSTSPSVYSARTLPGSRVSAVTGERASASTPGITPPTRSRVSVRPAGWRSSGGAWRIRIAKARPVSGPEAPRA